MVNHIKITDQEVHKNKLAVCELPDMDMELSIKDPFWQNENCIIIIFLLIYAIEITEYGYIVVLFYSYILEES